MRNIEEITPKSEREIVHHGVRVSNFLSKYVPNQAKKPIIPAI